MDVTVFIGRQPSSSNAMTSFSQLAVVNLLVVNSKPINVSSEWSLMIPLNYHGLLRASLDAEVSQIISSPGYVTGIPCSPP